MSISPHETRLEPANDSPPSTDLGRPLASKLVADLRLRWAAGEPALAESYLERHAELRGDASAALDLIFAEYLARIEHGEAPERDDYFRRFPALVPALKIQFDLDDALRGSGQDGLSTNTGASDAAFRSTDVELPTGIRALVGERTVARSARVVALASPRFRVVRPHALGGLGVVSVAIDSELNREVALKEILDEHADDPVSRERFLLEAEITGGLEHPGIVPVYGLGSHENGRPYYAMRFIRGENLQEAIRRFHKEHGPEADPGRRTLAIRQLLRRFLDVCHAVGYAHSRGILHRDIKPSNVIVGRHGETLLVDWGLAKAMGKVEPQLESVERALVPTVSEGSAQTRQGWALGTLAFMSPEQAAGKLEALGPRSDIYSLGASLYVLLTGRAPFEGDDLKVLDRVKRGEFAQPCSLVPTIDPALEAVCLKAMATNPAGRYISSRELVDDVERWMADEPVSAWREPLRRRARRWARRNRTAVSAVAVALVAAFIGLSALAYQQARSNAALANANSKTLTALAQSEESRRRAEAVEGFMVDAFQAASPNENGRELKVFDVLARAVDQLDQDTSMPVPTKGAILESLGKTYSGLGLWPEAERVYRRARSFFEASLGPRHRETLRCAAREAVALWDSGRAVEALPRIQEALLNQRQTLGRNDEDTLETQFKLGERLSHSEKAGEGIALLREVLEQKVARFGPEGKDTLIAGQAVAAALLSAGRIDEAIDRLVPLVASMKAQLGPTHPSTLYAQCRLAQAYISAGKPGTAIPLMVQAVDDSSKAHGPDDVRTLEAHNTLAMALYAVGRIAEAAPIQEKVLQARERTLGPEHHLTLAARTNLAAGYMNIGRLDEAIAMYQQLIRGFEASLGPQHPNTLISRNSLAAAYTTKGQVNLAVPLHRANLKAAEAALGPDHPKTLTFRDNLAAALEMIEFRTEAEGLFRRNLDVRRRMEKPESPLLASALSNVGRNLLLQSRDSEAEPLLRESLTIREKVIPDDWRRFSVMSQLGAALAGQARYTEAEPLILGGYEGLKARKASMGSMLRRFFDEAADRVVRLYEAWGRTEEAQSWAQKLGKAELPKDVFARP